MEREANYTAVGVFVLLVTALAGLFVYWYSDSRDHRDYQRYEIYFDGSVSGLVVGGQVRYLGVDVGRIVRIRLDPRAADRVQVIADIDSKAPISQRTLAKLSLQGVTGLLYLDLLQSRDDSARMPAVPSERYPVIDSMRSEFDVLVASLPDIALRTNDVLAKAQGMLSAQNTAAVGRLLANLDRAGQSLPPAMAELSSLLGELRATATDTRALVNQARGSLGAVEPDLRATAAQLRASSENLGRLSARLDAMTEENRAGLRAFTQEGLPQLEQSLRSVQQTADDLSRLSRALAEDPSQLLFPPTPAGVELPR
jgi:phospholipid/cholesterol/gamma-HCH transport system substrate-binding protein